MTAMTATPAMRNRDFMMVSLEVVAEPAFRRPRRSKTAALGYGRDLPSVFLGLACRALTGLVRWVLVGHELARGRAGRRGWGSRGRGRGRTERRHAVQGGAGYPSYEHRPGDGRCCHCRTNSVHYC